MAVMALLEDVAHDYELCVQVAFVSHKMFCFVFVLLLYLIGYVRTISYHHISIKVLLVCGEIIKPVRVYIVFNRMDFYCKLTFSNNNIAMGNYFKDTLKCKSFTTFIN